MAKLASVLLVVLVAVAVADPIALVLTAEPDFIMLAGVGKIVATLENHGHQVEVHLMDKVTNKLNVRMIIFRGHGSLGKCDGIDAGMFDSWVRHHASNELQEIVFTSCYGGCETLECRQSLVHQVHNKLARQDPTNNQVFRGVTVTGGKGLMVLQPHEDPQGPSARQLVMGLFNAVNPDPVAAVPRAIEFDKTVYRDLVVYIMSSQPPGPGPKLNALNQRDSKRYLELVAKDILHVREHRGREEKEGEASEFLKSAGSTMMRDPSVLEFYKQYNNAMKDLFLPPGNTWVTYSGPELSLLQLNSRPLRNRIPRSFAPPAAAA